MLAGYLYIFLDKCLSKALWPYFNWIVVFSLLSVRVLFFLGTRFLSDIWFTNTFSHFIGCLFTFLIVTLDVWKFLILLKFSLSIFFSHGLNFWCHIHENTVLSPLNGLGSLIKNQLTIHVKIYFWAVYSIALMYVSVLMPVPYCFTYYSFVVSLKLTLPTLFFFFEIVSAILGSLQLHMNLKTGFSISVAKAVGILIEIVLNMMISWVVLTF